MFESAKWIWLCGSDAPNQYICFRKKIFLSDDVPQLRLHISADSDFVVYFNGVMLDGGQYSDWPEKKSYTTILLNLKQGDNVLAVLGYYRGTATQCYAKGPPGLIAEMENGLLVSDESWKCLAHPAYVQGQVPFTTAQLGYTIEFNAEKSFDWTAESFDDAAWQNAQIQQYPNDYRKTCVERPITTKIAARADGVIVMQGCFIRQREYGSAAETVYNDYLRNYSYNTLFSSPKRYGIAPAILGFNDGIPFKFIPFNSSEHGSGFFVVVDLKRETAGMLEFEINASAGTVCDIAVGEHLADGRVRAFVGGRNFADRYICRAGHNCFRFPFRRFAGRYIELHMSNLANGAMPAISYLGIVPVELELHATACFQTNDHLANRTHEVAAHTLKLCMHEHYEDCPWREQALYAYDSRNQMLYGYYLWGNYQFAAASLSLLGNGIRPDGQLEICAPCHMDLTLPVFSMVWVSALAEYQLHSGNTALTVAFRSQIKAMIDTVLPLYQPELGLFACFEQDSHWAFYEWTAGLDGIDAGNCKIFEKGAKGRIHAGFNLYFYEMLNAYLILLHGIGEDDNQLTEIKSLLATAIHHNFWDARHGCYASKLVNNKPVGYHEHIQALALYNKIVPANYIAPVVKALTGNTLSPISFAALSYLVRALMEISPETRRFTEKKLEDAFHPIILNGGTTLWETNCGAADFDDAGSLCHAWSSVSVYFAHACVLGIRPVTPGFKTFQVTPYPGSLYKASGTVATPAGFIKVKWTKRDDGLIWAATGPDTLHAVIQQYPEVKIVQASYNGKNLLQ